MMMTMAPATIMMMSVVRFPTPPVVLVVVVDSTVTLTSTISDTE